MKKNIISAELQKELFRYLNRAMNEVGDNANLSKLFDLIWNADNK